MGEPADFALALVLLAPVSYGATNLDNLLLLTGLLGTCGRAGSRVVAGFLAANALVLLAAAAAAGLGRVLPVDWLSWLGLVPLAMGLLLLRRSAATPSQPLAVPSVLGVTGIFLGNSGDTLAVFAPLFAESEVMTRLGLGAGFLLLAPGTAALARYALRAPAVARFATGPGARMVPWLMILLGVYVLIDSSTDLT
jgi:cadmium resistance protein CadD (predicted permease)